MTHSCVLLPDLLNIVTKFAWGVSSPVHILADIEHVLAFREAIPDIFMVQWLPRFSQLGLPQQSLNIAAIRLSTRCYDKDHGFLQQTCEAFVGNPYRTDQPYHPSYDLPVVGVFSNTLWFLVDMIENRVFRQKRIYKAPTRVKIRRLWTGPISNWNKILKLVDRFQDILVMENFKHPIYFWEAKWPELVSRQIKDARYAESTAVFEGNCCKWRGVACFTTMLGSAR